jgi:hypothetical protein
MVNTVVAVIYRRLYYPSSCVPVASRLDDQLLLLTKLESFVGLFFLESEF